MPFFVVYNLLLLYLFAYTLCLVCLYFVPGRGCFIAANLVLSHRITTTMDLAFALPYILLCLPLWHEWHMLDPGALLPTDPTIPIIVCAVALAMVYSRDFFLGVTLFIFARYIAITICAKQFTAMCFIVGCLSWMPTTATGCAHFFGAAILCAHDILLAYIRCATATISGLSDMAAYMSKTIMKAIRTISLLRVYRAMAVLGLVILFINVSIAAIFYQSSWR